VTRPELGSLDDLVARIDAEVAAAAPFAPGAPRGDWRSAQVERDTLSAPRRHLVFSLAGSHCALPIASVVETGHAPGLTRVPNVPRWVAGVTNLRGDVLAVVDLRAFLGFEPLERRESARLLVAQSVLLDCRAGFLVDGLHGALALAAVGRPAAPFDQRLAPYLRGTVEREDRPVALLDLEAIFRTPEMRLLREG